MKLALVINFIIRPRETVEAIIALVLFDLMLSQPLVFVGVLVLVWVIRIIDHMIR